jgi:hypothetical protein
MIYFPYSYQNICQIAPLDTFHQYGVRPMALTIIDTLAVGYIILHTNYNRWVTPLSYRIIVLLVLFVPIVFRFLSTTGKFDNRENM